MNHQQQLWFEISTCIEQDSSWEEGEPITVSHSLGENGIILPLIFYILGHEKIADMTMDQIQSSYNSAQQYHFH